MLCLPVSSVQSETAQQYAAAGAKRANFETTFSQLLKALQRKASELELQLAATSRTTTGSLVDNKAVGKPFAFAGTQNQSFQEWRHKLIVYMLSIYQDTPELLQWAESQQSVITKDSVATQFLELDNPVKMSTDLYAMLTTFTEGEANKIVRSIQSYNGLETWRQLKIRYDPKTLAKGFAVVGKLSKPKQSSLANLREDLLSWESDLLRYQDTSNEHFSESHKMAAIIAMCPKDIQQHIALNSDKYKSYADLRMMVFNYLEPMDSLKSQATDMDIGALNKGFQKGYFKGASPKGWQARPRQISVSSHGCFGDGCELGRRRQPVDW